MILDAPLVLGLVLGLAVLLPWIIEPLLQLLLFPRDHLNIRGSEHVPRSGPVLLASNQIPEARSIATASFGLARSDDLTIRPSPANPPVDPDNAYA